MPVHVSSHLFSLPCLFFWSETCRGGAKLFPLIPGPQGAQLLPGPPPPCNICTPAPGRPGVHPTASSSAWRPVLASQGEMDATCFPLVLANLLPPHLRYPGVSDVPRACPLPHGEAGGRTQLPGPNGQALLQHRSPWKAGSALGGLPHLPSLWLLGTRPSEGGSQSPRPSATS